MILIFSFLMICWLPAPASSADREISLRGSVRDLQGEPLVGATIRLLPVTNHYWNWFGDFPPEAVQVSRSGGDGSFLIQAPTEGLWTLAVEKKGMAPMHFELQALLDDLSVPEIVLRDLKTVRLRASDPAGKPIRDAWILPPEPFFSEPPPYNWQPALVATQTGARGVGEVRVPENYLPRAPWSVEHPVHRSGGIDILEKSPQAVLLPAAATGGKGSWVAVENPSGAPAKGFLVIPPKRRAPVAQVEDDDHAWLPDPLSSSAHLRVLTPQQGRLGSAAFGDGVESQPRNLSLPKIQEITGQVRDEVTRKAIPGAFVWLARDRGIWAKADAGGVWRLPVGQGEPLVFGVDARGYLPRTAPLDRQHAAGSAALQMSPAASLEVSVKGAGGSPVSGLEAEVRPLSQVEARTGRDLPATRISIAADGSGFVARKLVPSEPYEMVVRAPGFAPATLSWNPPAGGGNSTVTMVLKPAKLLRGRVVTASGEPLGNVEVILVETSGFALRRQAAVGARFRAPTVARAFTSPDGTFRLGDLPEGPLDLIARKGGFSPGHRSGIRFSPQEHQLELGTLTLGPTLALQGRVVDSKQRGIEGADIFVAHRAEIPGAGGMEFPSGSGRPLAVTNAEGVFLLRDLEPDHPINLQVQRVGFVPEKLEGVRASQSGSLVVTLSSGGSIEGFVVDGEGRPLVDASVEVTLTNGPSAQAGASFYLDGLVTSTDTAGGFALRGVPPGDLKLRARADGYQPETQRIDRLGEGQVKKLTVRLSKGVPLEGLVVTAEGAPAGGATVQAGGHQTRTDKAGQFRLDGLAPGQTRVTAGHSSFGRSLELVDISSSGSYVEISLSASGRVVSRTVDENDAPIEGATVRLFAGGAPLVRNTDRQGTASFPLVPSDSEAVLFVEKEGYASAQERVHVEASESTEVTLVLDPSCALRGQILSSQEEKMDSLEVFASRAKAATVVGTVDFRGEYHIADLSEGSWTVVARGLEGRRAESSFECSSADRRPTVDLELEAGFPLVALVSLEGQMASGTEVQIRDEKGSLVDGGRTDHTGRFEAIGLKKGNYQVRAVSREWGVEASEDLQVPSVDRVEIDLVRLSLAGNVYDSSTGLPVSGARLRLLTRTDGTVNLVGDTTTGPQGRFNFLNVDATDLRIAIERQGFAKLMLNIPVASLMAQPSISIPLQPAS